LMIGTFQYTNTSDSKNA